MYALKNELICVCSEVIWIWAYSRWIKGHLGIYKSTIHALLTNLCNPTYQLNPRSEDKYKKSIYSTIRKKVVPDLEYVDHWVILHHTTKYFGQENGGKIVFDPWHKSTQKSGFCPFWGWKSSKSKKFFFFNSAFL